MKGEHLDYSKKTWNGQMERRALLAAQGIELPDQLDELAGKAPVDDLLDAAAAAWTAWRCVRGTGEALSGSDSVTPLSERGVIDHLERGRRGFAFGDIKALRGETLTPFFIDRLRSLLEIV